MQQELIVDEDNLLFNTYGMEYREFPSDYSKIRSIANYIVRFAPEEHREINLLEQQISELIKNAIKHGNKCDENKPIKVWFDFNKRAKLIIEDEGEGFQNLEQWNEFYRKRMECFENHDFENLMNYVSYHGPNSTEEDGGNSLLAAIEYWNGGMIYNNKKNKVVVVRYFPVAEEEDEDTNQ